MVVANSGSNDVSVLLGRPDGSFDLETRYVTGGEPASVATGDFDADGDVDVAVVLPGSESVAVMRGAGDGTLQSGQQIAVGGYPRHIIAGDIDADGRPDLVVSNVGSHDVSLLIGNRDGTFGGIVPQPVLMGANTVQLVAVDLNGDGNLDLAAADVGWRDDRGYRREVTVFPAAV